jgi:transposase
VKKGSKPRVGSPPGRDSVPYSGYVLPSTGELYVTEPTWFNYKTVIESFRAFINSGVVSDDKRIIMVLDNAPWHKKAVRLINDESLPEYADIRARMTIINLPPYSPDLNPIEQVWRKTRREITHNRYFKNVNELKTKLDNYFDGFKEPNEELKSLCSFKHGN